MIDYNLLDPIFSIELKGLITDLDISGYEFVPYIGRRSCVDQAKDWRVGRDEQQFKDALDHLMGAGAPYLAACLNMVGPQPGTKTITNALPGLSWHQFGKAADLYWQVDEKAVWEGEGYTMLKSFASNRGLTTLARMGDNDHVQSPKEGSPEVTMNLRAIDAMMKQLYGG